MKPFTFRLCRAACVLIVTSCLACCCTVTGGALRTAEAMADAPLPVRVLSWPAELAVLAIAYPSLMGCLIVEDIRQTETSTP